MAEEKGTLAALAEFLARLIQPLEDRLVGGDVRVLLAELGLELPATIDADGALSAAAQSATQRVTDLPPMVKALADAVAAEDVPQIIAKSLEIANAVGNAVAELTEVATAIRGLPGTGVPAAELDQFADQLPGRLVDYLLARNLEQVPPMAATLDFIGFLQLVDVPAVDPAHPAFVRRAIDVGSLTDFIGDPASHLLARYEWGSPTFTGLPLLQKLSSLMARAGVPAILDLNGPVPLLDFLVLEVSPKLDDPQGLRIRIAHPLVIDPVPFSSDDWTATLTLNTDLKPGVEIILTPDDGVSLTPLGGAAPVQGDLKLDWKGGNKSGPPYVIVGEPGGSRLEARQFGLTGKVGFAWNAAHGQGEGTWKVGGEVGGGKLVVSLANADGFLGSVLGDFGLESDFNVGLGFSSKEGLTFAGSASLDIQLPLHVTLGPVEISALTISVGISGSTFPLGLRTDIMAALGPLQAVIEQIGVGAELSLPANMDGNAGPVDVALKFLAPKGVGLSLDVGAVKGGGYLFIDEARGEYAGALELALFGVVTVKAIGIITTKMPDGSEGFSLLIAMSVEFGTGIQLGFGFTLLAVGGIVGLNRTMNLQALAEGVRSGAIDSVMFPRDIIANAPKIISDLRTFFPPQQDRFLIGPMVKIGWGTPTLASISLGIIIEIPGNIAIVGTVRIALPADEVAIVVLQVNFIGAIEFDKQRVWFFASLFESRVVFLTIEGEMGLLVAFGDDANFVLSVGGFHPRFAPPPLPFPSPRRVSVDLINNPVVRVRVEGYFAVTSNTVQFGARVEAFFGVGALNAQGHLGLDALFQFSPFYFIVEISASFSVNVFGIGLFSVGIRGTLEGPTPWHVLGHGSISLLFWDIDVELEKTWGDSRDTEMPPIEVFKILGTELDKTENWRAILPTGAGLLVSLRPMPETEAATMLHPVGVLRFTQRAVPLELKLDKVGAQKPVDVNKLRVKVTGGGLEKRADAMDKFAPAQFQSFSDADKLSKPAFEPELSGLDLSATGADTRSSVMTRRVVRYEAIILDTNYKRFKRRFHDYVGILFNFFLAGAAVTHCELSQAVKSKLVPFDEKITVNPTTYAVAFTATNQAVTAQTATFHSQASALEFLATQLVAEPALAGTMHVIPSVEMAA